MSDVLTKCGDVGVSRGRNLAKRGVAMTVALAVLGTSSLAWSQAKAPAKPAAPAKAAPAKAPVKGDKKAAGAAFKKGKEAFEKKDFKTAKESFMEAEDILPAPTAEYYIGLSAEELGEWQEAAKWYSKALDGKLKDDQAADAKARLEALNKKPAPVKVTSDPAGATILVDGAAIPEKTPADIQLAPGTHKITLKAEGRKDLEQTVQVAAFTGATVSGTLEEALPATPEPVAAAPTTPPPAAPVEPTPAPTPDTGKRDMTWVYVTGGAAVVALGVGTVFGLQALSKKSDFDDAVTAGNAQAARDARDDGTRNALISDMGFGIGITLAVTSAVLFFTRPAPEGDTKAAAKSSSKTFSFAPVVSGTGAGAAALIQF